MGQEITASKEGTEAAGALPSYGNVDEVTRARIGGLAARDFSDQQIADVLLLTKEQVLAAKESPEAKKKYAEVADQQIQIQLDLADGWDAVEEKAVAQILQTLEYNRDPKYALFAGKTANTAIRRRNQLNTEPKVIDNSKPNGNVIQINLNKTYVRNAAGTEENKTLDITPTRAVPQLKQVDMPSPAQVDNLLAGVKSGTKDKVLTELEQAFELSGIFKEGQ